MAKKTVRSKGGFRARLLAVMSYLGILCFVPLLRASDDEFVHFHARQGLIIWMIGIVGIFSFFIPGAGKWLFSAALICALIFSVTGILSVLFHRAWKIPLVYSLSRYI
ncbi:hypothetical protein V5T82_16390 [Magnetovibrio sp. PR-2]|uniref:hypothetical protein n=1 Tax=Magnetovibrio sp. PR-2 TaxID=3120356 RepID=UPI002FCDEA16